MKLWLDPSETQAMLAMFARPHFTNEDNFTVVVRTDPDWVRTVLPPPLVASAPIVTATLSQSDQFRGAIVGLQCAYDGAEGEFGLGYVMDTDLGVVFGWEGLAAPKKLGDSRLVTGDDGGVIATVSRFGRELIHIEAGSGRHGDPGIIGNLRNYHFKYSLHPDGSGIDNVRLVEASFAITCTAVASLRSKVDMVASARYIADVDADAYLPFAFAKHDDYRLTMPAD